MVVLPIPDEPHAVTRLELTHFEDKDVVWLKDDIDDEGMVISDDYRLTDTDFSAFIRESVFECLEA